MRKVLLLCFLVTLLLTGCEKTSSECVMLVEVGPKKWTYTMLDGKVIKRILNQGNGDQVVTYEYAGEKLIKVNDNSRPPFSSIHTFKYNQDNTIDQEIMTGSGSQSSGEIIITQYHYINGKIDSLTTIQNGNVTFLFQTVKFYYTGNNITKEKRSAGNRDYITEYTYSTLPNNLYKDRTFTHYIYGNDGIAISNSQNLVSSVRAEFNFLKTFEFLFSEGSLSKVKFGGHSGYSEEAIINYNGNCK